MDSQEEYAQLLDENPEIALPKQNIIAQFMIFWSVWGWHTLLASGFILFAVHKLRPHYEKWKKDRRSAEYHKNDDGRLRDENALNAARARQQEMLKKASEEYELKKERELAKKNAAKVSQQQSSGHRLGSGSDYLPLSGSGPSGNYRPPKKSKCPGGGCGK